MLIECCRFEFDRHGDSLEFEPRQKATFTEFLT
jgi:hypothetical protein